MEEQFGNENEAISAYRQAFQLDPWMTRTLFFFATSLRKTIAEEQASHVYDVSALWKGLVALDEGDPADARSHFERAIIFEPRNERAYASLALAYQLLGDTEQAWKNVQIAIFVDSSSPYVQHIAGRVAYQQGREPEAIEYFDRAFSLIQSKSYSADYYGGVYRRAYLTTDLVPQFRRADLTPGMAEDFHILAEYWVQNGNDEKAAAILDFISREMN
jgi:tetratricopeptide (TPR) repeat protein